MKRYVEFYAITKIIYSDWCKTISREPAIDLAALRPHLRHHAALMARQRLRSSKAVMFSLDLGSVTHLVFGIATVTVLSIRFDLPGSPSGIPFNPSIVDAAIGVLLGSLLSSVPSRAIGWQRLALGAVCLFAAIGFIYSGVTLPDQHGAGLWNPSHLSLREENELTQVAALAIGISLAGNVIIDLLEFFILFTFYIKPIGRVEPEVVMVSMLMGALRLTSKPAGIANVQAKRDICRALNNAAIWLQSELHASLAGSDARTDSALKQRFIQAAGYITSLQLKIVFAENETLSELREEIAMCIAAILRGEYGLLPTSDSMFPVKRSLTQYLISFIRAIMVGLIPIACVIAARYAGLNLPSEFIGWAAIFSIGWAAITVISLIDPLYKTRLAEIREFIATVRGTEK